MDIVTVQIERSAHTKIVIEVPEYEVPVLQAIHGDVNVHELDSKQTKADFDADEAFTLLEGKYGGSRNENGDVILHTVYPNARALARQYKADKKALAA